MNLDQDEMERLALLARIDCSEDEKAKLFENLSTIVTYVEQLGELDLADVTPCQHVFPGLTIPMREDEPEATLSREEFLANAPAQISGMVRVPTIIQKDQ